MTLNLTPDDIARLKTTIELGVSTKVQIKDLNESLRDTLGEVSKELDLPKKLLNDAIKIAAKAELAGSVDSALNESQEELDTVQELLDLIGRR